MENFTATLWATLKVLKEVALPIYLGLVLATLSSLGAFDNIGRNSLAKIAALTGIHPQCAAAVILSFGDRMAGMTVLSSAKRELSVSDNEIIAANMVSKAPSVIQFFLFSFLPVVLSLFPTILAIRFLLLYFLSFLLISLLGVIYARNTQHTPSDTQTLAVKPPRKITGGKLYVQALSKPLYPFARMMLVMGCMAFIALLLTRSGLLNKLTEFLPIDANLLPIAGVGLISMLTGMISVGSALQEGLIGEPVVVSFLFILSMLHNTFDLFSASLPRAIAVFGSSLGTKVALTGFAVTQTVMLIMLIIIKLIGW